MASEQSISPKLWNEWNLDVKQRNVENHRVQLKWMRNSLPHSAEKRKKKCRKKPEKHENSIFKICFFVCCGDMVWQLGVNRRTYIVHHKPTNNIHKSLYSYACIRSLYLHDVIIGAIQSSSLNGTTCALDACRVPAILYHCARCLCGGRMCVCVLEWVCAR